MAIEISYDDALMGLERAVAEKGANFSFNDDMDGCFYFKEDGAPLCIVGHVFAYMGVALDDINGENGVAIDSLIGRRIVQCDDATMTLLERAQNAQDMNLPWGSALASAKSASAAVTT